MKKLLAIFFCMLLIAPVLAAQSLLSGDLAGVVSDPQGAVVANATVTLKSLDNGSTQSTTANGSGAYRFSLLKPGRYQVSANQTGFQAATQDIVVAVGQTTTTNITLGVTGGAQTVTVSAEAPVINTESASSNTTFSQIEVHNLPTAGGDITNIAQTAPGTLQNNTGGFGNFTNNGLPGTSNLFTMNGENDMDPEFNINNSGATNLTLGNNEVQEATVISNPYGANYGQLSGAQVNYVTKSGSNAFHGNAEYFWNGRTLNSNDWFANNSGTPRPFSNDNQWAASVGGPIIRNKTFFFFDTEGLHVVLPNLDTVDIPSAAFANAVVANVTAKQPAEAALYTKMFALLQGAAGASRAQPLANGCGTLTAAQLPGFAPDASGSNCVSEFIATPTALSTQYILSGRVDQNFGNNDRVFFRLRRDNGLQATTIDPINPAFNATSPQPAWDGQLQETHIFGPRLTNQLLGSLAYYDAIFQQNQPLANNTFPFRVIFAAPVNLTSFNNETSFPQGRKVTQWQVVDDVTYTRGNHNFRFGENFRRYDLSDHNFFFNFPAVNFGTGNNSLQNFVNGLGLQVRGRANQSSDVPVAWWGLGGYVQDEWKIKQNFSVTAGLRLERDSNPTCNTNCFANFSKPYQQILGSNTSAQLQATPYNQMIAANLNQAYPSVDTILPSPRLSFAYSPRNNQRTVISGGFGLFYDAPAVGLADSLLTNPPVAVDIRIRNNPIRNDVPVFDLTSPNNPSQKLAANKAAFVTAFNNGASFNTLTALLGNAFAAPGATGVGGTLHSPRVQEWNLQVQQAIGNNTSFTLNYTGNHAIRIPIADPWLNASDPNALGVGLPLSSPNPAFTAVSQFTSSGTSNYNGVTATIKQRFSNGVSGGLNYTWSHAMDMVSNGGIFSYGDSILGQIDPFCLRCDNVGNADYDVRHNITAWWVYQPGFHFGNRLVNQVLGGWTWGGKLFWHTGLPFSVTDSNIPFTNGGTVPAQPLGGGAFGQITSCGEANATTTGSNPSCLDPNAFLNTGASTFAAYPNGFPIQARNQYRGPKYFNTDMSLNKNFKLTERMQLGVGANAFNVFNHPNFANPDSGFGDPTFGQILGTLSTPTSPYGSFLGFNSSVRVVQLTAHVQF